MVSKHDKYWEQKFKELEEYKEEHGDCNVPQRYPDNPPLGRWVNNQRRISGERRLPDNRKTRLEELGFDFESGPGRAKRGPSPRAAGAKGAGGGAAPAPAPPPPAFPAATIAHVRRVQPLGFPQTVHRLRRADPERGPSRRTAGAKGARA